MKDCIMAQSQKEGATVGSSSSPPPEGSTTAIGSTKVSSAVDIVQEVGALVETSPRDLFDVPVLGLALFICACRCLRKLAPTGAVM
nr:hypothetical protein CFP56_38162 [Quercus suber]